MASSSSSVPRGPVSIDLTFYVPPADNSPPYNYVENPPPGQPQRNFQEASHTVNLTDIRNHESNYSLDKDAFLPLQNIPSATNHATFDNDDDVVRIYYPEVEKLLLDHVPGSFKVVLFDHTIRRERPDAKRAPVNRAHVDQTPKATVDRVRLHTQDEREAEQLLRGRYRIINVWKPINGPVVSSPLAFARADSVNASRDLVPVQHRYPTRTGETMGVKFHPDQVWLYWSGIDDDERLLLKCSDSWAGEETGSGIEARVPHSAFWDPRTPAGAKGRESIEVRALVFG